MLNILSTATVILSIQQRKKKLTNIDKKVFTYLNLKITFATKKFKQKYGL